MTSTCPHCQTSRFEGWPECEMVPRLCPVASLPAEIAPEYREYLGGVFNGVTRMRCDFLNILKTMGKVETEVRQIDGESVEVWKLPEGVLLTCEVMLDAEAELIRLAEASAVSAPAARTLRTKGEAYLRRAEKWYHSQRMAVAA